MSEVRILITNTGPWGTGSGTVADGVMQELLRLGHDVIAFFPDSGLPGADYNKYYGDRQHYHIVPFPVRFTGEELYTFPLIIPDPNPRNFDGAWTFRDLSTAQMAAYFGYIRENLNRVLAQFQPDVVECQHIWAMDHIVGESGYAYACVAHHSDQMGFHYDRRMREYACRSAAQARYVFAISDYVRKEVLELYGVNPAKVITIANGYDQEIFQPLQVNRTEEYQRFSLGRDEGLPLLTFCGKISATKGVDVLLQANRIIQQERKVRLVLLGGGNLTNFLASAPTGYSLENVSHLGHRSQHDLARLHNLASLSVLPSRSEGFGIAALEAMGCGVPVVASQVGGLADFTVGGLVPPEDPAALARTILNLLSLPGKQQRELSAKALQNARRYSWRSLVAQRLPYYEEIARMNRRKSRTSVNRQWIGTGRQIRDSRNVGVRTFFP